MGQIIGGESRGGCIAAPKILIQLNLPILQASYIRNQGKLRGNYKLWTGIRSTRHGDGVNRVSSMVAPQKLTATWKDKRGDMGT